MEKILSYIFIISFFSMIISVVAEVMRKIQKPTSELQGKAILILLGVFLISGALLALIR